MNVLCSAPACPVLLNSACVFYQGSTLNYTSIVNNDSLEVALIKINAKFQDAGLGYVFQNGLIQDNPGDPVELGGSLLENRFITGAFTLGFEGNLEANSFIKTGGTSSEFLKADGSVDGTTYQPAGPYITGLTGDGTAAGSGVVALTLASIVSAGTWGSATQSPVITIDAKGRVTNLTSVPITVPSDSLSFFGDVQGLGTTGTALALTLQTVNANIFGSNTPLKFSVNEKGLVTSAALLTNLDIDGLYGYTPAPTSRNLTINGVTFNLAADRSWTINSSVDLQSVTDNGNTTTNDIEITDSLKGIILQSPDSTRWRFSINNAGELTATSL